MSDKPFTVDDAIGLTESASAMSSLIVLLPKINLEALPQWQRHGFTNALESLHAAIHQAKQRLALPE